MTLCVKSEKVKVIQTKLELLHVTFDLHRLFLSLLGSSQVGHEGKDAS